jgi:uncharacterized protein (TIGR03663 family)
MSDRSPTTPSEEQSAPPPEERTAGAETDTGSTSASARATETGVTERTATLLRAAAADRLVQVVTLVTAVAFVARLVGLGGRVAHQDEARVAYWTLRYAVTGQFEYRPIIHGPFLQLVGARLFELFGASDLATRLPVAVLGGLMPAAALLFRERLRDSETVVFALLLAFNPVLLYYSRFMRSDVPLVVFIIFAVGAWVRAIDREGRTRRRYLYAGAFAFGLALTTKENAVLYPVCWLGALVVIADRRLQVGRATGTAPRTMVADWLPDRDELRTVARRAARPTAGALAAIFFTVVFFYAPRGGGIPAPTGTADGGGLWTALVTVDPGMLVGVLREATVGTWTELFGEWAAGGHQDHAYLPFLEDFLQTLRAGGAVISVAAVGGFLADRYRAAEPRDIVTFAFLWGIFSVIGYPLVTDIAAPWTTVHALVPLAIPAAVGVAWVYREGMAGLANNDRVAVGAAVLVLVVAAGYVGFAAVSNVYTDSQSQGNELVQYAQSSSTDLKPVLEDVRRVARDNEGTDVLFFGGEFNSANEAEHDLPTAGSGWFARLPFIWYLEAYEYNAGGDGTGGGQVVTVDSTATPTDLAEDPPPVVIALGGEDGGGDAEDVRSALTGYLEYEGQRYQFDGGDTVSTVHVFVDPTAVEDPATVYDGRVDETTRFDARTPAN